MCGLVCILKLVVIYVMFSGVGLRYFKMLIVFLGDGNLMKYWEGGYSD